MLEVLISQFATLCGQIVDVIINKRKHHDEIRDKANKKGEIEITLHYIRRRWQAIVSTQFIAFSISLFAIDLMSVVIDPPTAIFFVVGYIGQRGVRNVFNSYFERKGIRKG